MGLSSIVNAQYRCIFTLFRHAPVQVWAVKQSGKARGSSGADVGDILDEPGWTGPAPFEGLLNFRTQDHTDPQGGTQGRQDSPTPYW